MKPMLAQTGDEQWLLEIENEPNWVAARKWDGVRILFFLNDSGNKLLTRSGTNIVNKNPRFQKIVGILDGTILDSEGVTSSNYLGDVQSLVHRKAASNQMKLVLFDCLRYKGERITYLPLRERIAYLKLVYRILKDLRYPVSMEKLIRSNKRTFYRKTVKSGGEGVMTKDLLAPYSPGRRTSSWIKVKPRNTYDFIIMGFTQGSGKYSNQIGAIIYGTLYEGQVTKVGRSSGMTDKERLDMTRNPRKYIGKVAEFEAQEITRSGAMRHPSFVQLRPDLKPSDIKLEAYL